MLADHPSRLDFIDIMRDDDSGHFSRGARLSGPAALTLHFRAHLPVSLCNRT